MILESLITSVALSIDNFTIGVVYGAKGAGALGTLEIFIIALVNALGQFLSVSTGSIVGSSLLSPRFQFLQRAIPAVVFSGLAWNELKVKRRHSHEEEQPDHDSPQRVTTRSAVWLGLTLSLTNLAGGLSVGLSGTVAPWLSFLTTLLVSFVIMKIGRIVGGSAARLPPRAVALISAVVFFVLAISQLWP